jgi:hypothetical protein
MVRKHRGMPIFTRIVLGCVDESVRFGLGATIGMFLMRDRSGSAND